MTAQTYARRRYPGTSPALIRLFARLIGDAEPAPHPPYPHTGSGARPGDDDYIPDYLPSM